MAGVEFCLVLVCWFGGFLFGLFVGFLGGRGVLGFLWRIIFQYCCLSKHSLCDRPALSMWSCYEPAASQLRTVAGCVLMWTQQQKFSRLKISVQVPDEHSVQRIL